MIARRGVRSSSLSHAEGEIVSERERAYGKALSHASFAFHIRKPAVLSTLH